MQQSSLMDILYPVLHFSITEFKVLVHSTALLEHVVRDYKEGVLQVNFEACQIKISGQKLWTILQTLKLCIDQIQQSRL